MGYYSDPTANLALGNINREFSKIEKRVCHLWSLLEEEEITPEEFDEAVAQYEGVFKTVAKTALLPKPKK